MRYSWMTIQISCILLFLSACNSKAPVEKQPASITADTLPPASDFGRRLSDATLRLTHDPVTYDPGYFAIPYPNGDVPPGKGVCTDVVIRALRKLGIDLQQAVHEDMSRHFNAYPNIWGLKKTDTNIDHRRVPNLMTYFARIGAQKPITLLPVDYLPGDIVCWKLAGGLTHIGLVVDKKSADAARYLIVHNIGQGQVLADCLFSFEIIGHYRLEGR
ncbi:MAG: DUF1287 domain-containing protein [Saprospiraceae bacterium]|nr:DUF1287 domain-containing protein [Saprospiraceae bacterium]